MTLLIIILLAFVVAATALYGPQAAALVEMFPTRVRYTAMSFPYHVGTGWVGGFLPVTSFALVAITGNIYSGLWYSVVFTGDFGRRLAAVPQGNRRPAPAGGLALGTPVDVDRLLDFGEHAADRQLGALPVGDRLLEHRALLIAGDGDQSPFAPTGSRRGSASRAATGASAGSGSGMTPTARRALGASSASWRSGPAKIEAVCPSLPMPSQTRSGGQGRSCSRASAELPASR